MNELLGSGDRNYPLNCWYVVGRTDEFGPQPVSRRLLGRTVLLYRAPSVGLVALEDCCPHCSLPLSRGRVVGGNVVCGYHGLVFAPTGECIRVPSQQHVPPGSGVRAFPVREEAPYVWMRAGEPARAPVSNPPRLPWAQDSGWSSVSGTGHVAANYLLVHNNAMDLTHYPFVHGEISPYGYLASPPPLEVEVTETSVTYRRTFPPAPLVEWHAETTGLPADQEFAQRESGQFLSPALHLVHMVVLAPQPDGGPQTYEKILVRAITPQDHGSTHIFWQLFWNFSLGDPGLGGYMATMHRRMMDEDAQLLEDIQAHQPALLGGMRINADIAFQRAYQIVRTMLAEERGRATIRPRFGSAVHRRVHPAAPTTD